MQRKQISKRLATVGSFVPQGARLVDIGSDHAYLPIALVQKGQIKAAIAGEVVAGPYQSACQNVAEHSLQDKIEVRLANGLAAFEVLDQMDTLVVAGMGGRLISEILAADEEKLSTLKRLILQPNNHEDRLRSWLHEHGWVLIAEEILEEAGKVYEIMVAEKGSQTLSSQEVCFGPYLLKEKSAIFQQKWQKEQEKLSQALARIPATHELERQVLTQKIQEIKEVLDVSK
ncbi:tRNA (adenine(22)-N(1))-methyltransferase [Streptococcus himalayensis]|uniref:SAM-dependent methyltransferase n=1 Tax=Streptococcus himalayensis TaxID=1888195 RepID=A0A917A727_9STRE|nr:tRNA (adenine(22)-N(1))-methyltransferase TrmK [Streptococcus himalayensis]GGE31492.1 SAM-dependent methyltransferase [Streptococcus himalayensis]